MKVVSFVSQKGGVFKTGTAVNVAVVAATTHRLEVVVIDLDPQVSACEWADIRVDETPLVVSTPVPHLERTLRLARENGADLALIDTAGRANDAATAAARVADLIIVPVQPSLIDLNTIDATVDLIKLAGGRPTRALLTRVKSLGSRHDDAMKWLRDRGVECCPVMIGERVTYQDAYAQGLGVTEAEPTSKAADEIRAVYKFISRIVGLPVKKGAAR